MTITMEVVSSEQATTLAGLPVVDVTLKNVTRANLFGKNELKLRLQPHRAAAYTIGRQVEVTVELRPMN